MFETTRTEFTNFKLENRLTLIILIIVVNQPSRTAHVYKNIESRSRNENIDLKAEYY